MRKVTIPVILLLLTAGCASRKEAARSRVESVSVDAYSSARDEWVTATMALSLRDSLWAESDFEADSVAVRPGPDGRSTVTAWGVRRSSRVMSVSADTASMELVRHVAEASEAVRRDSVVAEERIRNEAMTGNTGASRGLVAVLICVAGFLAALLLRRGGSKQ